MRWIARRGARYRMKSKKEFTTYELQEIARMCTYVLNTSTKETEEKYGYKVRYISSIGQKAINNYDAKSRQQRDISEYRSKMMKTVWAKRKTEKENQ